MEHKTILKRAWDLLWQYKALWIFGIILALTSASYSPQSSFRLGNTNNDSGEISFANQAEFNAYLEDQIQEFEREFNRLKQGRGLSETEQRIFNILFGVFCSLLVLIPIGKAFYYIAETALIKMVDQSETEDKKASVKEGFTLGWSKAAWRMFLVDLVIFVPMFILFIVFMTAAFWPLFAGFIGKEAGSILALISTIGLFFLLVFLSMLASAVIRLLKHFIRRELALADSGVFEAIAQGSRFAFRHLKEVGIMWVIMAGINLAWPLVLLPIFALFFGLGAAGGGLLSMLTYSISAGSIAAVAILGGSFFLLILALPLLFIGGLKATFFSSTWTLTYRELKVLEESTDLPES